MADSQVSTADANGDGTQNDLQISASVAMTNAVTINGSSLTGTNHIIVLGTNLGGADTITGGAGADTIDGGAGNDTITGGADADVLTGGTGADHFVFNATTEGTDQITDFNSAEGDLIDILASAFGDGLTTGTDASTVFGSSVNSTFASATERFHYNTTTHAAVRRRRQRGWCRSVPRSRVGGNRLSFYLIGRHWPGCRRAEL